MLLTESADSTDYLLNAPNTGLKECLGNEVTAGLLKSLIVSPSSSNVHKKEDEDEKLMISMVSLHSTIRSRTNPPSDPPVDLSPNPPAPVT